jgi:hypothetical protein
MESGLIFNQLICEFESRHPCQVLPISNCQLASAESEQSTFGNCKSEMFLWVVAQLAEHRTVTAAREGSTPFDPPKLSPIANCPSNAVFQIERGL